MEIKNGIYYIGQKEFIKLLAQRMELPEYKVKEFVRQARDLLIDCLSEEIVVRMKDIGVLRVKDRKGYTRYSKLFERDTEIPDKKVVSFKPSRKLNRRMNSIAIEEI